MADSRSNDDESPFPDDSVASNGLTILIPGAGAPTDPDIQRLNDSDSDNNESEGSMPKEGHSFAGMMLKCVLEAGVSSPVARDSDEGMTPDIE